MQRTESALNIIDNTLVQAYKNHVSKSHKDLANSVYCQLVGITPKVGLKITDLRHSLSSLP
jgi:hypothetical protein